MKEGKKGAYTKMKREKRGKKEGKLRKLRNEVRKSVKEHLIRETKKEGEKMAIVLLLTLSQPFVPFSTFLLPFPLFTFFLSFPYIKNKRTCE